jgi:hypothetical protein
VKFLLADAAFFAVQILQSLVYTVPKAFSMHETFPKLLGKISKTTWKY